MALYLHRSACGPRYSPGGNLPARLEDNVMREGGEDIYVGVHRLGLLGIKFRPPRLCVLVVGDVGVWTSEHLRSVHGAVSHDDWLRSSFWGGPQLVAIRLYRGPGGDYLEPASTVLSQSVIAEGRKLSPEILSHLHRLHPD